MATESLNNTQMNILYKKYGDDFVKLLTKELLNAGKDATGLLIKSLDSELKPLAEKLVIMIESEDYFTYVDQGRRPGKYPPISEISKWASIKGISQTAVFPIARSIYKYGIKPTNVLNKAISKMDTSELEKNMAKQLEIDLANELKTKK